MKRILILILLFYSNILNGQLFFENFDGVSVNMSTSGSGTWSIENSLSTSSPNCYRGEFGLGQSAILETPTISTIGKNVVYLSFKHICKIEFIDSAKIEVSTDLGVTWESLYDQGVGNQNCIYLGTSPIFAANKKFNEASYGLLWDPGNISVPLNSQWLTEIFDISALCKNKSNVRIRWRTTDVSNSPGPGVSPRYGWLIDDIVITDCDPLGPNINANALTGTVYSIAAPIFTFNITDNKLINIVKFHWRYTKLPLSAFQTIILSSPYSVNLTGPFADNDEISYYLEATDNSTCANTSYWPGQSQFDYASLIFKDGIPLNVISQLPYCNDFESTLSNWESSIESNYSMNIASSWQNSSLEHHSGATAVLLGCPSGYSTVYEGKYRDSVYYASPVFDFSNEQPRQLKVWLNYNTSANLDGVRLEYTFDPLLNDWQTLGLYNDADGTNWYNTNLLSSTNKPGWSGQSSGWVESTLDLSKLFLSSSFVRFRFVYNSAELSFPFSFYIDDFCLSGAKGNDLGISSFISVGNTAGLPIGEPVPIILDCKNFGLNSQSNFNVNYQITGNASSLYTVNIIQPVLGQTSLQVSLPNCLPISGPFQVCAWTSLAGDEDILNDKVCKTFSGVPYFPSSLSNSMIYQNNFNSTPSDWVTDNIVGSNVNWVIGNSTIGSTSGNAFIISGNNSSQGSTNCQLYSPFFDLSNSINPQLSFYYATESEEFYDGMRLEYSDNFGLTWEIIGDVQDPCSGPPPLWYTQNLIYSSLKPAFNFSSSNGNGWIKVTYNLNCKINPYTSPLQFRFVFTSDEIISGSGFAIKDFELRY